MIHDYLVSHVHFDGSQRHWTSYGAIMLGYATAQGYNSAYQYLMNHLGIDACFVSSRPSDPQSHAWNMIQIDGKYYNVDTVCDESESARVSHKHFLLSTDDLAAIKPASNPTKHKLEDKVHACTSTNTETHTGERSTLRSMCRTESIITSRIVLCVHTTRQQEKKPLSGAEMESE